MNKDNRLEDIWFMSGGNEAFVFNLVDKNNDPLYIRNCQIKWTLCEIGNKDFPIIKKSSPNDIVFVDDYSCRVEVSSNDTANLYDNKYEHELILIQPSGKILRPSYGYITVRKGSNYQ